MTAYTALQGRTITLPVEWLDYPGGPASPVTAVTVEISPAAGGPAVVGPTAVGVAGPSTGLNTYTWQVPPAQTLGDYLVIWRGTDGAGDQVQATDLLTVAVSPAAATSIIMVADAKLQLNISAEDTSQDDELAGYIAAVTEVIEHIIGPVVPREVVEVHDGGREALVLRQMPVLWVTSVTENGAEVSGYALSLEAGVLYRGTGRARWAGGRGAVTVTYQAGRTSVLASAKQAAKELLALHFRSQQGGNYSPFDRGGDASASGDVILGFFVPNRVMQLLAPHQQMGGMA